MGKRTISFSLSESEVERAIKELEAYKKEVVEKTNLLRDRVAERLKEEAQNGFNGAIVDDLITGGARIAEVDVIVESRGSITAVIASGDDAVWVEFGAGVYHNGSPGTSPHPRGAEMGLTIGGFGKGRGKKEVWGFFENGELKLTHGTPAKMPMARAVMVVCDEIVAIAKEVFG